MNREQKAAFIDDVAERVEASEAIFAVDYRGITVSQVAELRGKLGEAGASFQIVKNTLTSLALDKADGAGKTGSVELKEFLTGPTAFTYVKGDIALAAKAISNFTKEYELLEYKGGVMEGQIVSVDQFKALTKLPSRDVLNGQLVGLIAMPIGGLARGLGALLGGLAIQLGAIRDQGLVGGDAPAPAAEEAPAEEAAAEEAPAAEAEEAAADEAPAEEAAAEAAPAAEAEEAPAAEADEAPAEEAAEEPAAEADADEAAAEEAPAEEAEADADAE